MHNHSWKPYGLTKMKAFNIISQTKKYTSIIFIRLG